MEKACNSNKETPSKPNDIKDNEKFNGRASGVITRKKDE